MVLCGINATVSQYTFWQFEVITIVLLAVHFLAADNRASITQTIKLKEFLTCQNKLLSSSLSLKRLCVQQWNICIKNNFRLIFFLCIS